MRLVLASASPRRRELLTAAGFAFDVDAPRVDETPLAGEAPADSVLRVARAKAEAVAARHPGRTILAADTEVVVDGRVMGKPADEADAARMLRLLAGRAHDVITGVVVIAGGSRYADLARTAVWVSSLTAGEIAAYVASGEPMDKAGAYAIQGLASRFIPRIDGSYTNVVGLPIALAADLLRQAGAA